MKPGFSNSRDIHYIANTHDICGEGVVWHPEEKAVYWTDINRRLLHCYTAADAGVRTWKFDQPVTAVELTSDPKLLLIVLGGSIIMWDIENCSRTATLFHLASWPVVRCNDARVGPDGALWFGTMQNNVTSDGGSTPITENLGELFSLDARGQVKVWHEGIGITNTVAWSPDGSQMFFGDTISNRIYVSSFDRALGLTAEPQIFIDGFDRGQPDGSAVDAEGYLWNCRYGGNCIVRFAPDGSVAEVVEVPAKNPTTCAFGGADLKTLYITSAAGADAAGGALFSMRVETAGLPQNRFRL